MQALRNACFTTTTGSARPLARAVLMNSRFITSMTPERARTRDRPRPEKRPSQKNFFPRPAPRGGKGFGPPRKQEDQLHPKQKKGWGCPRHGDDGAQAVEPRVALERREDSQGQRDQQ